MTQVPQGRNQNEAETGTFAASFFLACLPAMELEGVVLEEDLTSVLGPDSYLHQDYSARANDGCYCNERNSKPYRK
jgi:hypothetical protein